MNEPTHPGDPRHPDHDQWLFALGRATYASQRLAGIAVDVLRVHCNVDFWDLVPDTLGKLIKRLDRHAQSGATIPGLVAWLSELADALEVRNDLMHALPVANGLHRRVAGNRGRVVNYFDMKDLDNAAAVLIAAHRTGSKLLYHDGGSAVAELRK